ncbi:MULTISPECIES: endonuclease domain-containing protein [Nocardia]|uniref:endonuclease domain-containing protein n=1 Tax=Nocardia TaxID=1817 RepID=UPI001E2ABE61|nr:MULTISPECIES: endonuclease domain-containing protein [Nocardia]
MFHANRSKASGRESQCRDCVALRKLRLRYGITAEQYQQMLSDQDGRCAICDHPPVQGDVLAVDHCHIGAQQVRSLLCRGCNTGLGLMREDPAILLAAAAYLQAHAA